MIALLCTLSPKRRSLLEEDPTLVVDLVQARRSEPIPGMLELGKAWDALDVILNGGREGDGPLSDAVLARHGKAIGPALGNGDRARVLEPARVVEIADALEALPDGLVRDRYRLLRAHDVHGGYGTPTPGSPEVEEMLEEEGFDDELDEEIVAELEMGLEDLRKHYRKAAESGHGMLAAIT